MADNLPPVVIVGGFLARNSQSYWGDVEQFFSAEDNRRKVIIAPVGACSSLHDRACEIFYSLKGGRVDYGAEHAQVHKHGRYGRKYLKGLYPEWDITKPVHFVTHSLGGPTVLKLIALLRSNFFGDAYHPDMVRSIFAVAAPFKGTPTVYLLGAPYEKEQTKLRPISIGNFIAKYIHITSFLGPILPHNPEAWDFQPDSRNLGIFSLPHHHEEEHQQEQQAASAPRRTWSALKRSVSTLWSQLRTSDWADSTDSGSYDSGFHAADAREKAGENELNPNTFYCSLTGTITSKHGESDHHRPDRSFRSDLFLYILAKMVGSFSYNLSPTPEFLYEKPAPPQINTLSPPERATTSTTVAPINNKRLSKGSLRRTMTSASASFPPIEEEERNANGNDDDDADLGCLRSMGLHSRVASTESAATSEAVESRPSSSMSGSSGWRSSYESMRASSSSSMYTLPTTAEEEVSEPALSSPSSSSSSSSPTSLSPPSPSRGARPQHANRWSSTDWYADWAQQWSEVEAAKKDRSTAGSLPSETLTVPSAYDDAAAGNSKKITITTTTNDNNNTKRLRSDLWENDGVVPMFSQHHPSECSISHCQHHGDFEVNQNSDEPPSPTSCNSLRIGSFESGVWHVFQSKGMPHDSFVGGLARYESQRVKVWNKISEAMQDLDFNNNKNNNNDRNNAPSMNHHNPMYESDAESDTEFKFKTTNFHDTTFIITPPSPVVERDGH